MKGASRSKYRGSLELVYTAVLVIFFQAVVLISRARILADREVLDLRPRPSPGH